MIHKCHIRTAKQQADRYKVNWIEHQGNINSAETSIEKDVKTLIAK